VNSTGNKTTTRKNLQTVSPRRSKKKDKRSKTYPHRRSISYGLFSDKDKIKERDTKDKTKDKEKVKELDRSKDKEKFKEKDF